MLYSTHKTENKHSCIQVVISKRMLKKNLIKFIVYTFYKCFTSFLKMATCVPVVEIQENYLQDWVGVCLDEDNVILEDRQERSCCGELHIRPSYMQHFLLGLKMELCMIIHTQYTLRSHRRILTTKSNKLHIVWPTLTFGTTLRKVSAGFWRTRIGRLMITLARWTSSPELNNKEIWLMISTLF